MKALPCISSGKLAIMNCFVQPKSIQSCQHISSVCYNVQVTTSNQKVISNPSVFKSNLWNTTSKLWSLEKLKQARPGNSLRTICQASEGSSKGLPPEERGAVEKILGGNMLLHVSEGLQDTFNKPEICSADELHYVAVPGTNWRLSMWHYHPSPNAPKRNHPLVMLSGIGTNAIGFDLDPSVSMARYMAETGFDTWILEVRGAGLSKSAAELESEAEEEKKEETGSAEVVRNEDALSKNGSAVEDDNESKDLKADTSSELATKNLSSTEQESELGEHREAIEGSLKVAEAGTSWEAWSTATRISNTILKLSEKLTRLLSAGQSKTISARFIERISSLIESNIRSGRIAELREWLASLIEARENGQLVPSQIADLRHRLAKVLEDGQASVSPTVNDLQDRLSSTVDDFQRIVDLIAKYDWDFDNYLNEDVPVALDYVRKQTKPRDGKVLTIGHSMGGIVLYAHMSTRGADSGLAAAVSLASALDYGVSDTSLKLLLPLTDPAQLLNVPVVPLGALMTAIQPLVTRPPYALAWLGYNVSAQNMMEPRLFNKLILNNFGTIPVKLLLHLATVFQPGGLQNRDGTIKYKENICKVDVPVLAVAGDKDLICPPIAVKDTVKEFPKEMITYKEFGGEKGRHYGHYDLVCSPGAKEEVFPYLRDFLVENDALKMKDDKTKVEVSGRNI